MTMPNNQDSQTASQDPALKSTFADDPDMLELVQEFVTDMPVRAREIEALWEQRNRVELLRLAHQLKGASAGYGFETLGLVARTLETSLKQDNADLEALRSQVDDLVSMCNRVSL